MQFHFTEEQQLIRDTAREIVEAHGSSERLRAAISEDLGYDPAFWRQIGVESGWAGIAIPQQYGGIGLGVIELVILQHEQGRRLVPSPFFNTACLAAPMLVQPEVDPRTAAWLRRIAQGEARIAVALTGPSGGPDPNQTGVELQRTRGSFLLKGQSRFVVNGHACDAFLVVAKTAESPQGALSLALVDAERHGITEHRRVTLDATRTMADVDFDNVELEPAEILGEVATARGTIERGLDIARIALAAECVGAAERVLEITTQYAKDRIQFGRAIGSFQAVKHRLADMMVMLEAARSAVLYAACVANERVEELPEAAAIAKSACCDAFYNCAANAVQLHGGVGFTWEHDAHLYFKRARAAATLLGGPSWHRERLARMLALPEIGYSPVY